ncbi:MAG TPA: PAS domain-containing sensor histidine kinase [bacterium]|nr:PAS domain-containing sensor histidine kinase [bacterium]HQO36881.1 PAS domain-containing sensor histidine kinase [bacterium]
MKGLSTMSSDKSSTHFAPAETASPEEVERQFRQFSGFSLLSLLLDAIPDIVLILNEQRQIVYSNKSLLDFLGLKERESLCGLRPGEAFQCAHRIETDSECGTTEFCTTCGAVRAILSSIHGKRDVQECRILRNEHGEAMDLRVCATPFEMDGESFTFFTVTDISHEKRRAALERIFFHDILNTAGGLLGYLQTLGDLSPDEWPEYRRELTDITNQILEEIKAQSELVTAESGDLAVRPTSIDTVYLLEDLVRLYEKHSVAADRSIRIDPSSQDLQFISDPQLLSRVLGNLIKNGLEACQKGETVTVGCEREDGVVYFQVHNPGYMERDTQLQVFHRSFSTKSKDRGLGTYSVRLLTERYLQGRVSFTSTQKEGTTFRVRLPLKIE